MRFKIPRLDTERVPIPLELESLNKSKISEPFTEAIKIIQKLSQVLSIPLQQNKRIHFLSEKSAESQKTKNVFSKNTSTSPDQVDSSSLHRICLSGNIDALKKAINPLTDIDIEDDNGMTPLMLATAFGQTEIVQFLLENKADPNKTTKDKISPIHLACIYNQPEILQSLIKNKANVESPVKGYTPLFISSALGNFPMTKILLEHHANVKVVTSHKETPLHLACTNGYLEIAELLIQNHADIEAINSAEETPLHIACNSGRYAIVDLLIKHRANIEARNVTKKTPLHGACSNGHLKVAELLIIHKANVEALTSSQETPLHIACIQGHFEIVKLLLKQKANCVTANSSKITPLRRACLRVDHKIMNLLIKNHAPIEEDLLHIASTNGDINIVNLLIQNKVNVNAVDSKGNTPLHLVCSKGHLEIAKLLIKHGAEIEANNHQNMTPLHMVCLTACSSEHLEIAKLLIAYDAYVEATNKSGETPLAIACKDGNLELGKLLFPKIKNNLIKDEMKSLINHAYGKQDNGMCAFLFLKGIELNRISPSDSPLKKAYDEGEITFVKDFINHRLPIDVLDTPQQTAFQLFQSNENYLPLLKVLDQLRG